MTQQSAPPIHKITFEQQPCEMIREYIVDGQLLVHECMVAVAPDGTRTLKKLDVVCASSFFQPVFEPCNTPGDPHTREIMFEFLATDCCCTHLVCRDEKILQSHYWNVSFYRDGTVQLSLRDLYTFGILSQDPFELFTYYLQMIVHRITGRLGNVPVSFDCERAQIRFGLIEWLLRAIYGDDCICTFEPAHFKIVHRNGSIYVQYDSSEPFRDIYSGLVPRSAIHSVRFDSGLQSDVDASLDLSLNDLGFQGFSIASDINSSIGMAADDDLPDLAADDIFVDMATGENLPDLVIGDNLSDMATSDNLLGMATGDNPAIADDDEILSLQTLSAPAFHTRSFDYVIAQNPEAPDVIDTDSGCSTIEALHCTIRDGGHISPEVASLVIDEAREHLPREIQHALLYFMHLCDHTVDTQIAVSRIQAEPNAHADFFVLYILYALYTYQKNDSMRIAVVQKIIQQCHKRSHTYIHFCLVLVNLICEAHGLHERTVPILDEICQVVLDIGTVEEMIQFAQACVLAEVPDVAIQNLYLFVHKAQNNDDIIQLVTALVQIMADKRESFEKILELSNYIFDNIPQHSDLLLPLIQYLQSINDSVHAASLCQTCFEKALSYYHFNQQIEQTTLDVGSRIRCRRYLDKATQIAAVLESIYETLGYQSSLYNVFYQHLLLEPHDIALLTRAICVLENMHAAFEIAQICTDYLRNNADSISPHDEIAVQLVLHMVYDRDLQMPEKAEPHLNRARELSAHDPRVITAEIDWYQRRGRLEEQIGLRRALIDAVSPQAAVDQTLALVRLYEQLQVDPAKSIEILRQTNSRMPNNPQILLELRHYLRKSRQFFELATVLEKLAKVTPDLQMRKSILLEASEVNDQLGNKKVAESLYHEAQLCSPINPESVTDFGYGKPSGFCPRQFRGPVTSNSHSLTSALFTSQGSAAIEPEHLIDTHTNEAKVLGPKPEPNDIPERADTENISMGGSPSIKPSLRQTNLSASIADACRVNQTCFGQRSPAACSYDENAPLEMQISEARRHGSTEDLLGRLLLVISDKPEKEQPPRILQEIACIYLYDKDDPETARTYLERASALSPEIAYGEQTLNALERIYLATRQYKELGAVYEKKCEILTVVEERRKYEIRLAQLRYERLGETQKAIETLNELLARAPSNEIALQLLAQIYTDTQNLPKAVETLETISTLLNPNSKAYTQHIMRLSSMYLKNGQKTEAKKALRELLGNSYIDRLTVIESYKHICREDDEWQELLSILREEIAYYLHIPVEACALESVDWLNSTELNVGGTTHALREYADILYYKLDRIGESVSLFLALNRIHPDDDYLRNIILDIAVQHPENAEAVAALLDLCTSRDTHQNQASDSIVRLYHELELSFDSICSGKYDEAASRLTAVSEQITQTNRKSLPALISVMQKHLDIRQHPEP